MTQLLSCSTRSGVQVSSVMEWPRKESGRRSAATAQRPRTTLVPRVFQIRGGAKSGAAFRIKCRAPSRIRASRTAKRLTNWPVREDKSGPLKDVVRKPSLNRRLARFDSAANSFNDIITKLLLSRVLARMPGHGATRAPVGGAGAEPDAADRDVQLPGFAGKSWQARPHRERGRDPHYRPRDLRHD